MIHCDRESTKALAALAGESNRRLREAMALAVLARLKGLDADRPQNLNVRGDPRIQTLGDRSNHLPNKGGNHEPSPDRTHRGRGERAAVAVRRGPIRDRMPENGCRRKFPYWRGICVANVCVLASPHWGIWMSGFSLARREGLLVERVGEEVVLYDQDADVAHCLPASVAAVWEHADGTRSDTQIAAITGLTRDAVRDALCELDAAGLTAAAPHTDRPGHTRREAARRILGTGALAAAAPLIYTLAIAPAAAMASGATCSNYLCDAGTIFSSPMEAFNSANDECLAASNGSCTTCAGSVIQQTVAGVGTVYGWSGVCSG